VEEVAEWYDLAPTLSTVFLFDLPGVRVIQERETREKLKKEKAEVYLDLRPLYY
jgi:ribosomal protein L10